MQSNPKKATIPAAYPVLVHATLLNYQIGQTFDQNRTINVCFAYLTVLVTAAVSEFKILLYCFRYFFIYIWYMIVVKTWAIYLKTTNSKCFIASNKYDLLYVYCNFRKF